MLRLRYTRKKTTVTENLERTEVNNKQDTFSILFTILLAGETPGSMFSTWEDDVGIGESNVEVIDCEATTVLASVDAFWVLDSGANTLDRRFLYMMRSSLNGFIDSFIDSYGSPPICLMVTLRVTTLN